MRPKTPEALFSLLMRTFWMRLYGDITEAARRKRLTEHDIAGIERRILADFGDPKSFASEFPEFDSTAISQQALTEFRTFLEQTRQVRTQKIAQEH